uniref:Uncharacterized protein n=1 Tax=Myotis myotis TaxID=51298 RepID=A0A7J7Y0N9_MYOMY|nr:hypothetical protein mMyoMyo1_011425 [Myotis myotis]
MHTLHNIKKKSRLIIKTSSSAKKIIFQPKIELMSWFLFCLLSAQGRQEKDGYLNTSTQQASGSSVGPTSSWPSVKPRASLMSSRLSTLCTLSLLLFPLLPFPLTGEKCPGTLKAWLLQATFLPGPWL